MNNLLKDLGINYLLVNSTNEYLVEYSALSENARYTLTGFSGSTGVCSFRRPCTVFTGFSGQLQGIIFQYFLFFGSPGTVFLSFLWCLSDCLYRENPKILGPDGHRRFAFL